MVEPRNPRLPTWVVWLFADRNTGRIVIVQAPNMALWLFIAAIVASWVLSAQERLAVGLDVLATVALVWWAGDEIFRGANPWRRVLGGVVLAVTLMGLARTLIGLV